MPESHGRATGPRANVNSPKRRTRSGLLHSIRSDALVHELLRVLCALRAFARTPLWAPPGHEHRGFHADLSPGSRGTCTIHGASIEPR